VHQPPGKLGLSPEYAAMRGRHEALKTELAIVLAERLDLVAVLIPNLEAARAVRLGDLQVALLQLEMETRGMKRAIELVQAELNRGRSPDLDRIEEQIRLELEDWARKITEEAALVRDAEKRLARPRSVEEWKKVQGLFRQLARRLHPDVNPGLAPDEVYLWRRARAAHERRDPNELMALALLAVGAPSAPDDISALELLSKRCDELKAKIQEEILETERLKAERGWEKLLLVNDTAWVTARRSELEQEIDRATAWRDALAAEVAQMRAGADHRQPRTN